MIWHLDTFHVPLVLPHPGSLGAAQLLFSSRPGAPGSGTEFCWLSSETGE